MYIRIGPPILSLAVTILLLSTDLFMLTSGANSFCNELDIQKPPRFGKRDPSLTRCADHKRRLQDLTAGYGYPVITRSGSGTGSRDSTSGQDLNFDTLHGRAEFNNILAKLFSMPTKPMRHLRQNSGYSAEESRR